MEENETMQPTSEAQWTLEKCDSLVDENSKLTRENEAGTDSPSKISTQETNTAMHK